MNLQQFRFVRETIRRDFNLTEAARNLFTSQPGVSKAILEFEDELGVQIFERHGKRIKGLTKPGAAVAQVVERIMREIDNLKKVSDEFAQRDEAALSSLVRTRRHAMFCLKLSPPFVSSFQKYTCPWLRAVRRSWRKWCCTSRLIWRSQLSRSH